MASISAIQSPHQESQELISRKVPPLANKVFDSHKNANPFQEYHIDSDEDLMYSNEERCEIYEDIMQRAHRKTLLIRKNKDKSKSFVRKLWKSIKDLIEESQDEEIDQPEIEIEIDLEKEWQLAHQRDHVKDNYNLHLVHVQGWDEIKLNHNYYYDKSKCLNLRKQFILWTSTFSFICYRITMNKVFQITMLVAVIVNMIIFLTKYYQNLGQEYASFFTQLSNCIICLILVFFIIYSVEHSIKIVGLGIVIFFSEFWNQYDLISLALYGLYVFDIFNYDLSPLRAMRILIFLGKMSRHLAITLKAISESMKYMLESSVIVIILSVFFANVGLCMFKGLLKNRCFDPDTGIPNQYFTYECGWLDCPTGFVCYQSTSNPNPGSSFDSFLYSFASVVRTITMDNWTHLMYQTIYAYSPFVFLYFVLVIFIIGFFAFNLIIAVLKTYYSKIVKEYFIDGQINDKKLYPSLNEKKTLNLRLIKYAGIYSTIKTLQKIKLDTMTSRMQTKKHSQITQLHNSISHHIQTPHNETNPLFPPFNKTTKAITPLNFMSNVNKMLKRGASIKEKREKRQVLSARQMRLLEQRKNLELGIEDKSQQNNQPITLKSLFLPKRKFVLEKQLLQTKIKDDPKLYKILFMLKTHDILAWKLEVKHENYESNSQLDVLGKNKIILSRQKEQQIKLNKLRNTKLQQYYLHNQYEYQLRDRIQNMFRINTINQNSVKLPIICSDRIDQLWVRDIINESDSQISKRGSRRLLENKTFSTKMMKITKGKTLPRQEYVEFPIWQEGEPFILINGIKWNYKASSIKINHIFDESESEDDEQEVLYKNNQKYIKYREYDIQTGYIGHSNISIYNILGNYNLKKLKQVFVELNRQNRILWLKSFKGFIEVFRMKIFIILQQEYVVIIFDMMMLANFIDLCLYGIISDQTVNQFNNLMTFMLIGEIGMKLFGYGAKNFVKSAANILDLLIVIISGVQLIILDIQPYWLPNYSSVINALRAFKSFMLYRVVKYNAFIVTIMKIAQNTAQQYLNLTFLLFYVILIFAVIGLQFFVGQFDETEVIGQLHSFNSIGKSFMTVFDVMTNDDAYGMMAYTVEANGITSFLYYFALVFTINYMIVGLVMAVLLDAFSSELEQAQQQKKMKEPINPKDYGIIDNLGKLPEIKGIVSDEDVVLETQQIDNSVITNRTITSRKTIVSKLPENARNLFNDTSFKFQYYKNIECESSLFIFSKNHKFRRFCYKFIHDKYFRLIFNGSILSSIGTMIAISFFDEIENLHNSELNNIYEMHLMAVNFIMMIVYIFEIIAKGMWMDEGAFCRDTWRAFDIAYLISYIGSLITNHIVFEKGLYLIYLRPLMMINMWESIQGVKNAMAQSLIKILNVIMVNALIFLIFIIFGMHLYRGKMGYCENQLNYGVSKQNCLDQGKLWIIYPYNFENVFQGMLTLFVASSYDAWGSVMQACYNANTSDEGPKALNNQWTTYVFFILFIFIGAFFFMGFLQGMIFAEFKNFTKQMENKFLSQDQSQFIKITRLILHQKPGYSSPPASSIRKFASFLINHKIYKYMFVLVLFSNTVTLSMIYEGASIDYMNNINLIYQILSCMFISDTLLKLLSFGIIRYAANGWRKIEFLLSLFALIDLYYDRTFNWVDSYLNSSTVGEWKSLYRIAMMSRNFRVLLIIQEFKGLVRLMSFLQFTTPLLFKILYIQIVCMTCYSLIGQQLFSQINSGVTLDGAYENFKNFINAALVLFKCTTADDWRSVIIDTTYNNPNCPTNSSQCGSNYAYPFFLSYYLFSVLIIMNLFIMALVEQFETFFSAESNVIQTYVENIDQFCNVWCKYSVQHKGRKMHTRFIARFLLDLREPLGSQEGDNVWDAAKMASNLRIRAQTILFQLLIFFSKKRDKDSFVDFNELLYETFFNIFKQQIFKSGSDAGIMQMKEFDKAMKRRLQINLDMGVSQNIVQSNKFEYQNFNILYEYINVLITYRTWVAFTDKTFEKSRKGIMVYTEESSLSEPRIHVGSSADPSADRYHRWQTNSVKKQNVSLSDIEMVQDPDLSNYQQDQLQPNLSHQGTGLPTFYDPMGRQSSSGQRNDTFIRQASSINDQRDKKIQGILKKR